MHIQPTTGLPAQLNCYVRDTDSHHTSYGKHNRLVPFYSRKDNELMVREDLHGLDRASIEDCLTVAANPACRSYPSRKRLVHKETIESSNCAWFVFEVFDLDAQAFPEALSTPSCH